MNLDEEAKSPEPSDQQIQENQNLGTSLIDESNQQNFMNYSAQQQINSAQQLHTADPTLDQANTTQQKSGVTGITPEMDHMNLNERD